MTEEIIESNFYGAVTDTIVQHSFWWHDFMNTVKNDPNANLNGESIPWQEQIFQSYELSLFLRKQFYQSTIDLHSDYQVLRVTILLDKPLFNM